MKFKKSNIVIILGLLALFVMMAAFYYENITLAVLLSVALFGSATFVIVLAWNRLSKRIDDSFESFKDGGF
jgi:uncharacterized membrane protein